ncbi:hypothetical protein [Streptomyces kebangsaanensis]|uniref:hypothetical protein n=1 Tax=Streptomyces kebangsaanensis TaxID=864058 RepID=UPI00094045BE|nr:hypothetical protein [Streptomyces kebangsaanensis]
MSSEQGTDEIEIRERLIAMGVGPAAVLPPAPATEPVPPAAGGPSDAWWDELYADEAQPKPEPEARQPSPRLPGWWRAKPEQGAEQAEQPTEQTENNPANTAPTGPNSAPMRLLAALRWLAQLLN